MTAEAAVETLEIAIAIATVTADVAATEAETTVKKQNQRFLQTTY
jgi:hypothetical protein